MGSKPISRDPSGVVAADETSPADPIERIVAQMLDELPVLDAKVFSAALLEMTERPRTSLRYVLKLFTSGDPRVRAVAARILLRSKPASLVDDMNAVIFDVEQDAETKVIANDLLAQLGSAVDPDVFAMGVPDAESLQEKLPSQTKRALSEGALDAALAHARTLHSTERWLLIHDVIESNGEQALDFARGLANDSEEDAMAVVSAVLDSKLEAGVALMVELQEAAPRPSSLRQGSGSGTGQAERALQKLIKRALFEMRKSGIAVPDDKPSVTPAVVYEQAPEGPVVARSLMSAATSRGSVLVVIAWKRPNGRLQVFSVLVDLWKRGISDAILRRDMSRSAFERFVNANTGNRPPLEEAAFEDCCAMIARGIRLAREFGSRLPLDLGMGKKLLADLDTLVQEIENPFLCSQCNRPLEDTVIERIKADAPYDNIPAQTRCEACRRED